MLVKTVLSPKGIIVAASLALMGTAAVAQSADNSGSWGGLYFGLQGGYGDADVDWALDGGGWWGFAPGSPVNNASFSPDGALAGVHIGYGQVFRNNLYGGVDASFSFTRLDQSIASPAYPGIDTWDVEIDNIWDVSGRFGYTRDRFMVYGTAGIAGAETESRATPPLDISKDTHIGYAIGAGVEYMATEHVSVGLNYKYYDFGSKNHEFNPACAFCGPGDNRKIDVDAQVVTFRVTSHF